MEGSCWAPKALLFSFRATGGDVGCEVPSSLETRGGVTHKFVLLKTWSQVHCSVSYNLYVLFYYPGTCFVIRICLRIYFRFFQIFTEALKPVEYLIHLLFPYVEGHLPYLAIIFSPPFISHFLFHLVTRNDSNSNRQLSSSLFGCLDILLQL